MQENYEIKKLPNKRSFYYSLHCNYFFGGAGGFWAYCNMKSTLPSLFNLHVSCKYDESFLSLGAVIISLVHIVTQFSFLSLLLSGIHAWTTSYTVPIVFLIFLTASKTESRLPAIILPSAKIKESISAKEFFEFSSVLLSQSLYKSRIVFAC